MDPTKVKCGMKDIMLNQFEEDLRTNYEQQRHQIILLTKKLIDKFGTIPPEIIGNILKHTVSLSVPILDGLCSELNRKIDSCTIMFLHDRAGRCQDVIFMHETEAPVTLARFINITLHNLRCIAFNYTATIA